MHTVYRAIAFGLALTATSQLWGQTTEQGNYLDTNTDPLSIDFPELPPVPPATPPAQVAPAPVRPAITPRLQRLSPAETAHLPRQVQNVIDFYGGTTSGRALSQIPQRPSTVSSGVSSPPPVRRVSKPFSGGVSSSPTISPYLNLFREESSEELPNYHAFVRPMLQQQQTNTMNQRELNTLQSEVRQASYQQSSATSNGGVPITGHGTRYMNTSGFYPQTRRLK
ncbi:hypothetical protein [Aeoliella mucimassa]|uniref:Uncharacterized protein n=1 Tax=Aeoliella mucimassa TaxID=2527972 RepID=A0A518AWM3_9BACT|nr:hypothetical protein [Aeoliella mucimassa]QDU59123.1 hypothetical protein Pan181_53640 [Aeoliella mucimassa]